MLEAELVEEGILLRVRKVIDASQAWFWTPEWQAREREADSPLGVNLDRPSGTGLHQVAQVALLGVEEQPFETPAWPHVGVGRAVDREAVAARPALRQVRLRPESARMQQP